ARLRTAGHRPAGPFAHRLGHRAAKGAVGIAELHSPDAAQRAVLHGVVRCRAGDVQSTAFVTVPALRSSVKNAAARPGHEAAILAAPWRWRANPAMPAACRT